MTSNAHRFALTLASSALIALAFRVSTARAHFVLEEPASWAQQDNLGNPQKSGPCGETDSPTVAMQAKATNMVTPFSPGETITITIKETVYHPGHYRVALAPSRDQLPPDPQVTAGATACGSAEIQTTPAYPVLADGVLKHDKAFNGSQSFEVTLPTDVTCEKCTLQVIEFMSSHGLNNPGGCFYHHCADISIRGGGTSGAGGSGGSGGRSGGSGGVSMSTGGVSGGGGAGGALTGGAGPGGVSGSMSGGVAGLAGIAGAANAGAPSVAGALGVGGTVSAAGASPAAAAAGIAGIAGVAGSGTGVAPEALDGEDGGCAFGAARARGVGLSALAIGALALLRRVRRRDRRTT